MVKMISRDLLDWVNSFIGRWNPPRGAAMGSLDLKPTQKDKPSNHSSHDLMQTYRRLKRSYPLYKGYRVSLVANTNSMEPLLDDNSVMVMELLQGDWSDRLFDQPLVAGDIVTYDSTSGSIIHVLKKPTTWLGKPAWILQGTNNFLPDMSKVLEEQITSRKFIQADCRQRRDGD